MSAVREPVIPLTEFQREWIDDKSRYKIGVKPRRAGFTFASSLEIPLEMVETPSKWFLASRTQDTAKEGCREVQRHLRAFKMATDAASEIHEIATDIWFQDMQLTKFYIELPNGSQFHAMTAHPDAMRGFGGNVLLDEFGFHRDSHELWKATYAAILRGHRVEILSTPNYQQGKYFETARKVGATRGRPPADAELRGSYRWRRGIWSVHWLDIHTAIPQLAKIGVEIDIDELREAAGDEESFEQEFCCAFLSSSEMWIPLEMIAAARSALATAEWDPDREVEGLLYAGMDIARRKHLTVIWVDEVIGDVAFARGVIRMEKTPFQAQYQQAKAVLKHPKLRRMCIDETGIGMMLAEQAKTEFGYKVEPVTFSLAMKEEMSVLLRQRFEEKLDKIPQDTPWIEKAIAAVKREPTASGALRFDAARTDAGHADEYWAKALADLAHGKKSDVGPPEFVSSGVKRPSAQLTGVY